LRGKNAGLHDDEFIVGEGIGRTLLSGSPECFSDSTLVVSVFQLSFRLVLRELCSREDGAVLCLSKTLDDKALKTLMDLGLGTRFAKEYEAWGKRRIEILAKRFRGTLTQRQAEILINLEENPGDIQANVREAVISEILKAFP
jgi:hypothetical protein